MTQPSLSPDEHGRRVSSMFGRIVPCYDLLNRVLSLGCDRLWRARLARAAQPGATGRILDIAAGTLDVALALRECYPHILVPAVDFCLPMLLRGRAKLKGANLDRIVPIAGDATCLPLPDACVDSLTMAFGIRNIRPREAAFAEMLRVLRPGGLACILEFASSQERIWGGVYNLYLERLLPVAGRFVSGDKGAYGYLAESIRAFPGAKELEEELLQAGFCAARHERVFAGIVCLHIAEKGPARS